MGGSVGPELRSTVVSGSSELTTVKPSLSIISTSVKICTAGSVVSKGGIVVVAGRTLKRLLVLGGLVTELLVTPLGPR